MPLFVGRMGGLLVGGWRSVTGAWIVGLAAGEVCCTECDSFGSFPGDFDGGGDRFICTACADRLARMDER